MSICEYVCVSVCACVSVYVSVCACVSLMVNNSATFFSILCLNNKAFVNEYEVCACVFLWYTAQRALPTGTR